MDKIVVQEETSLALATVMARKDVPLSDISSALGLKVPAGPRTARGGDLTVLGTGPRTWLMVGGHQSSAFARSLKERLGRFASVSDQSSGYVVFRIGGTESRRLLQRGAYLDFDPSVFGFEDCAVTTIAHMGVIIWQAETSDFRIALFRSYRESFCHWLNTTVPTLRSEHSPHE